jgi:hypothetical protein
MICIENTTVRTAKSADCLRNASQSDRMRCSVGRTARWKNILVDEYDGLLKKHKEPATEFGETITAAQALKSDYDRLEATLADMEICLPYDSTRAETPQIRPGGVSRRVFSVPGPGRKTFSHWETRWPRHPSRHSGHAGPQSGLLRRDRRSDTGHEPGEEHRGAHSVG